MTRNGRGWEARLGHQHDGYARARLAWVARCSPPVKLLSGKDNHGRFRACFESDGPPDFLGVLAGGRGVVFDAKDTGGSRFRFDALKRHQARDLEAAHDRGALAFVALRTSEGEWVLPWGALGPLYWRWHDATVASRGRTGVPASLSAAELNGIGARMRNGDWLGALPTLQAVTQ